MHLNHPCTCLIVDDDEIDRLTVLAHVRKFPFIKVSAVYDDSNLALAHLQKEPVDILFLDIEMPQLSGIELRNKLMNIPVCIFISSFPEYALDGFESAALDFIVKPFNSARFEHSIQRALEFLEIKEKATLFEYSLGQDTIFIKEGSERIKIKLHDILYLEALKDYTSIVTPQKKYCVLASIGNLLEDASFRSFVRIHRSFAVQKHFIQKVDAANVYVQKMALPIGRTFKRNIDQLIL